MTGDRFPSRLIFTRPTFGRALERGSGESLCTTLALNTLDNYAKRKFGCCCALYVVGKTQPQPELVSQEQTPSSQIATVNPDGTLLCTSMLRFLEAMCMQRGFTRSLHGTALLASFNRSKLSPSKFEHCSLRGVNDLQLGVGRHQYRETL